MLNTLCQIAGTLADAAPAAEPNTIFGVAASTLGGGGAAAVFGAAWFFFRVIRKIIGTLFMLCVVYLVAKTAFGIDIAQYITPLFK